MFQKYRDPLRLLLEYIAEASTGPLSACITSDLDMNHAASI